jgi:hypothetical protein
MRDKHLKAAQMTLTRPPKGYRNEKMIASSKHSRRHMIRKMGGIQKNRFL